MQQHIREDSSDGSQKRLNRQRPHQLRVWKEKTKRKAHTTESPVEDGAHSGAVGAVAVDVQPGRQQDPIFDRYRAVRE